MAQEGDSAFYPLQEAREGHASGREGVEDTPGGKMASEALQRAGARYPLRGAGAGVYPGRTDE